MNVIEQLNQLFDNLRVHLPVLLGFLSVFWGVHVVNILLGYRLNVLGILPRHLLGLPGIVCSPYLHGHSSHLLFNTVPLIILAAILLSAGSEQFYLATAGIQLISGLLLWLFGRKGFHVGSSMLLLGYWGYLLCATFNQPSLPLLLSSGAMLYYFGGLLSSFVPSKGVSVEGHVFGFVAGILMYYGFPQWVCLTQLGLGWACLQ